MLVLISFGMRCGHAPAGTRDTSTCPPRSIRWKTSSARRASRTASSRSLTSAPSVSRTPRTAATTRSSEGISLSMSRQVCRPNAARYGSACSTLGVPRRTEAASSTTRAPPGTGRTAMPPHPNPARREPTPGSDRASAWTTPPPIGPAAAPSITECHVRSGPTRAASDHPAAPRATNRLAVSNPMAVDRPASASRAGSATCEISSAS